MFTVEQATAHACGDCTEDCTHPDHLWDVIAPDLDWLMFGQILGPQMQEALTRAEPAKFVSL